MTAVMAENVAFSVDQDHSGHTHDTACRRNIAVWVEEDPVGKLIAGSVLGNLLPRFLNVEIDDHEPQVAVSVINAL
jgi:hypothetical protein